jgi:hypothetical protein
MSKKKTVENWNKVAFSEEWDKIQLLAIDEIQHNNHHNNSANVSTCLRLPLKKLNISSLSPSHPSFSTLISPATIFQHYPDYGN